jgi:tetratricopeptide (TPR) repeat protein
MTTVTWRASVQLGAALVTALTASSVYPQGFQRTIDMLPLLPEYCRHTKGYREATGGDPEALRRWETLMGGGFNFGHMHHYCDGLADTHQAQFQLRTKQERDAYLEKSLREFDFVLRHAKHDFVLRPEIHTKKGENLLRLGRPHEAIPDFIRAINIKPDYWPPYAALSDYYKGLGDTEQARTWLEKGLAASPGAKPLRDRLDKISRAPAK